MLKKPDDTPVIESTEMLATCRLFMKISDYQDILSVSLSPDLAISGGLTRQYYQWEISLRNDLARMRAIEQGRDSEDYQRSGAAVVGTEAVAGAAMAYSSPLEAERYLDQKRWDTIEHLSVGHFFDMDFLRAYRLKLLIQERESLFDEEKGVSMYRSIHQHVLKDFLEK